MSVGAIRAGTLPITAPAVPSPIAAALDANVPDRLVPSATSAMAVTDCSRNAQ
jgi:hypothetical protein